MMKKILFSFLFVVFAFLPLPVFSRESVDYWYVKDFKSEITLNDDSSLDIIEYITADCGSAQKHGIFRTLPTQRAIDDDRKISMPIELASITDFNDKKYNYSTTKDSYNKTITWKIGDADIFVSGENYYKIHYKVKNAILHQNENFDEFYWNLSGNFWDIEIDNFSAQIFLPEGVTRSNSDAFIYSGSFGANGNLLEAKMQYTGDGVVEISAPFTMKRGEGITVSITFPDGIIDPYIPTFFEKYGRYFFFTIPLVVLIACILLWRKYGNDPSINPTIAPEFEIPENLCPIDMGLVYTDGSLKNHFISASIIDLAVKGVIKIEKIGKKGVFSKDDFKLIKIGRGKLSLTQEKLLSSLFGAKDEVLISSLKNVFYNKIPSISKVSQDFLAKNKWLKKSSKIWQIAMIVVGSLTLFISFPSFGSYWEMGVSLILSAIIIFIFSFLMKSRTLEGAKLNRRILGFKMYMETAEKYRQRFNEKENIFERFLPYAIMFGITKIWIAKMKEIYGEEYFDTYAPLWFAGTDFRSFNVDKITSEISALSSNMASTIASSPSSSGSGGGGFSGGGGGGGGGGGW